MKVIRRGEVWLAELGPTRGREQAGERPVLVVSADPINQSAADLVVAVPLTTRRRGVPTHVEVRPPAGGLPDVSFAMCEQLRSLPAERLGSRPFGSVPASVQSSVQDRLQLLCGL